MGSSFIERFSISVVRKNEAMLGDLIRLDEADDGAVAEWGGSRRANLEKGCAMGMSKDFAAVCAAHLEVQRYLGGEPRDVVAAFEVMSELFRKFLEIYREGGSWLLTSMKNLIHDTRVLAVMADKSASASESAEKMKHTRECKALLESCFRSTNMGRAIDADAHRKRHVGLYIVNNQFKVLFRLKTLQLCKNLIMSVEIPTFPNMDEFPITERVTYHFYKGRMRILEDRIPEARQALTYAWENCPSSASKNRGLILEFLAPINLFIGKGVTENANLRLVQTIMNLVRNGNVRGLSAFLDENQAYYINKGMLLTLDQLKTIAYRNLFRNIILIYQSAVEEEKKTRVSMEIFQKSFEENSEDLQIGETDTEEDVKCILANLIFNRYLKGYISHERNILVLSPKDPFPKLKTINQ